MIVAEALPAEEALRLARGLRASNLPADDPTAATAALTALRAAPPSTSVYERSDDAAPLGPPDDPAAVLLAALAEAADGGPEARAALVRCADVAFAPPYDPQRLRAEILALARTLARAPEADLRPGGAAYAPLAALWGALDALLS